jgi:hypothetical protein
MPEKIEKIKRNVMEKISSGRVKLRSKYLFLAEKFSLRGALALSFLLAILFFSIIFYYIKESDSLAYLSFGRVGMLAFLESLPYLTVIFFIIFLIVAGYLINKSDPLYKRPFKYLAVGLVAVVLCIGGALAYAGILERIEEQAFSRQIPGPIFRPFFEIGPDFRDRGIAGKILELNEQYLIIKTPRGERKVNIENLEPPLFNEFTAGQFIMAVGQRKDDIFFADSIKILEERDMPMIRRGIHRRFDRDFNDKQFNPAVKQNFNDGANLCPFDFNCEKVENNY